MHCGLKESRVRSFQQRRHCNDACLALHTVHCGLKESRVRFQQQRRFKVARLVLYHRPRIMAEHDTNSIRAVLTFCPRFDGKYKAQFLKYKDRLRVALSFHLQSVAAILTLYWIIYYICSPFWGCCLKKNQNAPRPSLFKKNLNASKPSEHVSYIQRIGYQPKKYFTRSPSRL